MVRHAAAAKLGLDRTRLAYEARQLPRARRVEALIALLGEAFIMRSALGARTRRYACRAVNRPHHASERSVSLPSGVWRTRAPNAELSRSSVRRIHSTSALDARAS